MTYLFIHSSVSCISIKLPSSSDLPYCLYELVGQSPAHYLAFTKDWFPVKALNLKVRGLYIRQDGYFVETEISLASSKIVVPILTSFQGALKNKVPEF